jgi:hypothetical protein
VQKEFRALVSRASFLVGSRALFTLYLSSSVRFGTWNLVLLWMLEFGVWSFLLSPNQIMPTNRQNPWSRTSGKTPW